MRTITTLATLLTCSLALGLAPTSLASRDARAEDTVLSQVPENALGFVVINRLSDTNQKVMALIKNFQPEQDPLAMVKAMTGIDAGFDEEGSVLVALLPGAGGSPIPTPIVFLPVSDYEEFLASFEPDDSDEDVVQIQLADRQLLVGNRGDYAVLAMPDAGRQLERVLTGDSLSEEELAPMAEWIGKHDLVAALTPRGVKAAAAAGREGLQEAEAQFDAAGADLTPQMQSMRGVFDFYRTLLGGAEDNVTHLAVGTMINRGGVYLDSRVVFDEDSAAEEVSEEIETSDDGPLGTLVGKQWVFAVGGAVPPRLMELIRDASQNMTNSMYEGLSKADRQRLMAITQELMEPMESIAMSIGVPAPGKPLLDNIVGVYGVEDAREYLEQYAEGMKAFSALMKKVETPAGRVTYKVKEVTIGDKDVLLVTSDMSALVQQGADAAQVLQLLFGEHGTINAYVADLDDTTLFFTYGDEARFESTLEAMQDEEELLANDEHLSKTTKLLNADSQWAAYWNLQNTFVMVNQALQQFGGGGFQVPPFPVAPPIGFAAHLDEESLETQIVLPTPTLKTIATYIRNIRGGAAANDLDEFEEEMEDEEEMEEEAPVEEDDDFDSDDEAPTNDDE